MPRIIVEWLEGRTQEHKKQLAEQITQAFVNTVEVRPDQVTVVFKENRPENQFKGGVPYQPIKL